MIKRELHRKNEAKDIEQEEKRMEEIRKQKERETAFKGWLVLFDLSIHE